MVKEWIFENKSEKHTYISEEGLSTWDHKALANVNFPADLRIESKMSLFYILINKCLTSRRQLTMDQLNNIIIYWT